MKRVYPLILVASALFAQTPVAPAPGAQAPADTAPAAPREPGLYATLKTTQGDIVVKFFELEAPVTVKNFIDLARGSKAWKDPKTGAMVKRPLYAGTIFHRVIPGFMIQGGDPTGTGGGEVGFTIADEFVETLKFDVPGRLAMANTGDPHTGSSQFFLTEVATPHLDGKHTIFGQVVEGQEVVTKIANVPRGREDKPRVPVRLNAVIFKREGPIPPGGVQFGGITPAKKAPVKKSLPAAK